MEKQVIKGFIEVTDRQGYAMTINVNFIEYIGIDGSIRINGEFIRTNESYDNLKKYIQESLNEDKLKQYQ